MDQFLGFILSTVRSTSAYFSSKSEQHRKEFDLALWSRIFNQKMSLHKDDEVRNLCMHLGHIFT